MQLPRALHAVGAGLLTGALLLGTASEVAADDIRDRQWALSAFGADDIWKSSTGKGVKVAVVDSGVDASHPDLKGQVLKGKDFTSEGGDPREDTDGHGTAMAGLIAGRGHGPGGGSGVKGLAPDSKILPIRFQHSSGKMGDSYREGVRYAVDHGADVINISQVGGYSTMQKDSIDYAIRNDVVVVAGAGNEGIEEKNYPARYPGVVSVGGWTKEGRVWDDSSWGSNTTLIAPAKDNVVPSDSESGYSVTSGTSDATAYVSAAAALVRSKHPDLSAGQVINRLVETAMPMKLKSGKTPKLPDEVFGYGVVRPYRAVTNDIPAGPKSGPLKQPKVDPKTVDAPDPKGEPEEETPGWAHMFGAPLVTYAVFFLVGVGVIVLVIVLIVKGVKRKRRSGSGGGNGPGGPGGPGWGGPPPQGGPQQQSQAPVGQFGGPPPPPPPGRLPR